MTRWANALLVGVSVTVAILGAEILLRLFFPQQLAVRYNLRDGMVIHPPGGRVHLAGFGQLVRFNSLGMRDREHDLDGTRDGRILLFGDSFMEALQVRFEDSFPHLLESRLRELAGEPLTVISAAVSGWGTDDQLAYLKRYGAASRPRIVLVGMTLHNDISDNLEGRFHRVVDGRAIENPRQERGWLEYKTLQAKDFMASRSHLAQLARRYRHRGEVTRTGAQLEDHVVRLIARGDSKSIARGWDVTYALLRGVRDVSRSLGAEMVVFLIPLAIQTDDRQLEQFLALHGLTRESVQLDRPQEMMRRFAAAEGVEVIDLLPHLRGRTGLHVHGHWNESGHRLAAGIVASELTKRGLVAAAR